MNINGSLMEKIALELATEYPIDIFREMNSGNHKWSELVDIVGQLHDARNKILGYQLGNDTHYLVYKKDYSGEEIVRFIFGVFGVNSDEFCLWDINSKSLISHYKINLDEAPTKEFCDYFDDVIKHYIDGYVRCSDCGEWMLKKEIAGQYYAGIYCKDCWESKWKDIEAKDNYD